MIYIVGVARKKSRLWHSGILCAQRNQCILLPKGSNRGANSALLLLLFLFKNFYCDYELLMVSCANITGTAIPVVAGEMEEARRRATFHE